MSLFDETTLEGESPQGYEESETVETEEELDDQQQDESTDDADGSGEKESTDEDVSSEEEQDTGLIAGKFKSVEDLTKAYKNLERSFHESRQTKQPAQQTPASQGEEENPNDIVQRAFANDPIGTIRYFVNQAMAPVTEQRESEALTRNMETVSKQYAKQLSTDEGVKAYFEKIGELANELGNPDLIRNPPARVMRMAAEELWGTETKQSVYNKAKAAGRQEAEATRQAKQGLNAPKGAKLKEQPKTEADRIKEGIMNATGGGLFG